MAVTRFLLLFVSALWTIESRAEIRTFNEISFGGDTEILNHLQNVVGEYPPQDWRDKVLLNCKVQNDPRNFYSPTCALKFAYTNEEIGKEAEKFYRQTGYSLCSGQDANTSDDGKISLPEVAWSLDQVKIMQTALNQLPSTFSNWKGLKCVYLSKTLPYVGLSIYPDKSQNIPAAVILALDFSSESLSRPSIEIVTHEFGHIWSYQFGRKGFDLFSQWRKLPDGSTTTTSINFVSDYAKTNPIEDFAESITYYRYHPTLLKKASLSKYNYIKSKVFNGLEYADEN